MLLYITNDNTLFAAGCLAVNLAKEDINLWKPYAIPVGEVDFVVTGSNSPLFIYTKAGEIFYFDHLYDNYLTEVPTDGSYTVMRQIDDGRLNGNVRNITVDWYTATIVTNDNSLYLFDIRTRQLNKVCDDVKLAQSARFNVFIVKTDGTMYIERCYNDSAYTVLSDELSFGSAAMQNVVDIDYSYMGGYPTVAALTGEGAVALFSFTPEYSQQYGDFAAAAILQVNDAVKVFASDAAVIYINREGEAYYLPIDGNAELITANAVYAADIANGVGSFILKNDGTVVAHTRAGFECRFLGIAFGTNTAPDASPLSFN